MAADAPERRKELQPSLTCGECGVRYFVATLNRDGLCACLKAKYATTEAAKTAAAEWE